VQPSALELLPHCFGDDLLASLAGGSGPFVDEREQVVVESDLHRAHRHLLS
jgi:hypothetical protein